jgi:antitoxin VapB
VLSESDWQAALHASRAGGVNLSATWHILMYTATVQRRNPTMQRRAKVFLNNRSQAVRLPKEFQFTTDEVFIRKEGEDVILSPRPTDWEPYLETGPVASDTFMENVENLPAQEREP